MCFNQKVMKRCQKGIPDRVRNEAWKKLARFDFVRSLPRFSNVVFSELLTNSTEHEVQITKDLDRTFPELADLQDSKDIGFEKLFNTLKAYAVYDPELGYCQSLSYVAGCLNMYYNAEV